jgi:hypothetical protein
MRFFLKKVTNASKRSSYRLVVAALSVLLATGSFLASQQHAAALRFQNRSLKIFTAAAGETTTYNVTFTYPTVNNIGSVSMLFCTEAIAYLPCTAPSGLNVSGAVLSDQAGETGFTISSQSQNSLIISRPPNSTPIAESSYTFTNVVNPDTPQVFYIRLNSYTSTNATGPFVDFGSVASVITTDIGLTTQVPPYLVFCTGKQIPADCFDPIIGPPFEEFEDATAEEAMATSSEMLAYTNARNGYVVVLTGRSLTSGMYEIPAIEDAPEESLPGKAQFGINLAENTEPEIGADPIGPALNITVNPDYSTQNKFLFDTGDILVTSNGVTKRKKYTVSYLINIPPDQHPGVYSATVTFICTANF